MILKNVGETLYNLIITDIRIFDRKSETTIQNGIENPQGGGGSS